MELITISQMQTADMNAINKFKIPGKELMYRAAKAISEEALSIIKNQKNKKVAIFCGPGNNGGDGWAVAVILGRQNISTTVFSGCSIKSLKGDAAYYSQIASDMNIEISVDSEPSVINEFGVIVDALFGIGLSRKIDGIYEKYIKNINNCTGYVISADIPSGLHSDEGIPFDIAVMADMTVCFGKAKTALFSQPGFEYSKKTIVNDIGIPEEAYEEKITAYITIDEKFALENLKPRKKVSSKGTYGKVLIVAGSPGMGGALSLCAESCYRSGTGLVYCAVPRSKLFEYDRLVREMIAVPVEDGAKPYLSDISAKDISKASVGKTAIVIGPGLSEKSHSDMIFTELKNNSDSPIIADAQVLNDISADTGMLDGKDYGIIITPHPGEMSGLTGKTIDYIQNNRIKTAMEFAKKHKVIVLLKGHKTIVTDGNRVCINTSGNPGMATAGSGDVLCGIIASFASTLPDLVEAAALGMYIHGKAGDEASARYGEYGMKAGDMINEIPGVIKNITGA